MKLLVGPRGRGRRGAGMKFSQRFFSSLFLRLRARPCDEQFWRTVFRLQRVAVYRAVSWHIRELRVFCLIVFVLGGLIFVGFGLRFNLVVLW